MSIPLEYRFTPDMEKKLLRESMPENILPREVLWRQKEAFSDGVSSQEKSWYEIIQDYTKQQYNSDCDFFDDCLMMHRLSCPQVLLRAIFT